MTYDDRDGGYGNGNREGARRNSGSQQGGAHSANGRRNPYGARDAYNAKNYGGQGSSRNAGSQHAGSNRYDRGAYGSPQGSRSAGHSASGQQGGGHSANRSAQGARQAGHAAGREVERNMAGAQRAGYTPAYEGSYRRASYAQQPKRRSKKPILIVAIVAVVAIAAIWWFIPKSFDVTFNGEKVTVNTAMTVGELAEQREAVPPAGNLLAVDGTVLTEGGGAAGTYQAGDVVLQAGDKMSEGMDIVPVPGVDTTEECTEAEEVIPAPRIDDDRSFANYWSGSIHLLADGHDGVQSTRTGAVSGKTATVVVEPAQAGGYQVYNAKPGDNAIALTFDDGPWPETTSEILDILEANGAKATFFTIGMQCADHPEDLQRAKALGCDVCTHTWDHADGSGGGVNITYMSADEQVDELLKGYEAIKNVLGEEPPHILRAPGGNFFDSVIDTLWPYLDAEIGWNVDTEDWRKPGADTIAQRIMSAEPGDVILMHDGGGDRSETVEALRMALPVLKERGYKFVTVSELLAYGNPEAAGTTQGAVL